MDLDLFIFLDHVIHILVYIWLNISPTYNKKIVGIRKKTTHVRFSIF